MLGEMIKNHRDNAGLTQAALGEMIGVTGASISQWETGAQIPPRRHIAAMVKAMKLHDDTWAGLEAAARTDEAAKLSDDNPAA